MRRVLIGLLALLASVTALLAVRPVLAQPPAEELGESAAFLALFPELSVLPAPAFLTPGARASYVTAGATQGGGGSGAGIIQYDVAAQDGRQAVIFVHAYSPNGPNNALIPLFTGYKWQYPAIGEFWINPVVLVNAQRVANQNLAVVRKTTTVNGQTFNVVRFQSNLNGAEAVWEFDTQSGGLVFYRTSTPGSGGALLTQLEFLNYRVLNLPFAAAAAPAEDAGAQAATGTAPNWARPNVAMNYSGAQITTVTGSPPVSVPFALNVTLSRAANTWSIVNGRAFVGGFDNGTLSWASGIGLLHGSSWLPRAALQAQIPTTPTVIDNDPVTGAQTTLFRANNGNIIIRQAATAFENVYAYGPQLGALDGYAQSYASPFAVVETNVGRTGGDDLVALNRLPPLPAVQSAEVYLPIMRRR